MLSCLGGGGGKIEDLSIVDHSRRFVRSQGLGGGGSGPKEGKVGLT